MTLSSFSTAAIFSAEVGWRAPKPKREDILRIEYFVQWPSVGLIGLGWLRCDDTEGVSDERFLPRWETKGGVVLGWAGYRVSGAGQGELCDLIGGGVGS